jgi:hypothetical protein
VTSIDNWIPFLKLDENGTRCMSQQTYEPLFNPEHNVFCANYDWLNEYQRQEDSNRTLYTPAVTNWFFENEVKNLLKYKDKPYAPTIIDIDYITKQIFFEWQGETCNEIIYSGKNLDNYCSDWKEQLQYIMTDLYNTGTYKLTMYPHCHFIKDGQMQTIDWYGCVPVNDPYIDAEYMDGIIHESAKFRLLETGAIINNRYNLEIMFQRSMQEHVKWGSESMEYIYKEIFNA